jgi:hypothetical protein
MARKIVLERYKTNRNKVKDDRTLTDASAMKDSLESSTMQPTQMSGLSLRD